MDRVREGRRTGERWRISSELITDCGPHNGPEPEGNKPLNTSKVGSLLLLLFDINQHSYLILRFVFAYELNPLFSYSTYLNEAFMDQKYRLAYQCLSKTVC